MPTNPSPVWINHLSAFINPEDIIQIKPLSGGCVGQVYELQLQASACWVVKVHEQGSEQLLVEAWMLNYLRHHAPITVPVVQGVNPYVLVMSKLDNSGSLTPALKRQVGIAMAQLHQIQGPAFGLEQDTLIGGLHQPNPWTEQWVDFYRDHRLLAMARCCLDEQKISTQDFLRLETLAQKLDCWVEPPDYPALLHGDLWHGNICCDSNQLSGFIDPAIYYGHPEMDLAFSTLFNSVGPCFFEAYSQALPIKEGFWELRKDLYNLYPLLVHVRLFGRSYWQSIDNVLKKLGC